VLGRWDVSSRVCLLWRIEVELCYLVVGTVAWPSVAVHLGTLGASSEYFVVVLAYPII
jgi:hypothetical protein